MLSDRYACLAGAFLLTLGALLLALFGSSRMLWACLPCYVPAVSLLRTAPASLVSKKAGREVVGEALGILDACSSVARIVTPLLCGLLFDWLGPSAPFGLQAVLSLLGVGALLHGTRVAASKDDLGQRKND